MANKNDKPKIETAVVNEESPAKVDKADAAVEDLRIAISKLCLKMIDDIYNKRVSKADEIYSALATLYNAIK